MENDEKDSTRKNNLEVADGKIGVFKHFAIFTGKHLCWGLFLTATLLKWDCSTGVFQWILRNFEEQFLYKKFLVAVPETSGKSAPADDNQLITYKNLRCDQQQRTTTNCCYKGSRQQK